MFSENSRKILTAAAISLIFFSACRLWQQKENEVSNTNSSPPSEISVALPFSNKEPENYQAQIITRSFADDEQSERKIFIARHGNKRLTVFNQGEKSEIALLNLDDGASFSIDNEKKIYTENKSSAAVSENELNDFLTTEWLNAKTSANFENLGTENNLTKFRVRLGQSDNSEILIYVDANLKIPVREEFYKVSGEQKTMTFSVEIKDFKSQTDENFFVLPKDYRKVSASEFQETIRRDS